jgi:O-antigen/teichoic acid export membrane protein
MISVVVVWLSDDMHNAGYLGLAMTVTNIFMTISLYNIRYFQVSDITNEYSDSEYVASRVLTSTLSFLLCIGFVFIIDYSGLQRAIIICYMLFRVNEALIDILHGINQRNHRMDYIGISLFTRGVFMLAVFVVLMWLFDLMIAVIGITVVTIIIGLIYDLPRTKKLAHFKLFTWKKVLLLLKRCFPLMIVLLCITMIVSYARYSLDRIHGPEAMGIYVSVANPTLIVQVVAFPLFAPLVNLFAACLKEGDKKKFLKTFAYSSASIFGVIIVCTIASLFTGEWGLGILYGYELVEYAYLLPGAFVVSGLVSYIWFMNLVFTAIRDIKGLFIGNLIGVIICLAATDFFLNRFGIEGINHVLIISQGIAVLILLLRLFYNLRNKAELFAPLPDEA